MKRVIAPSRGWVPVRLGELWAYRELLAFLAWRDVRVRYKQTVLGALWAILQPLVAMLVFTIFFHKLAGVAADGGRPYPLWILAGLLPWTFFVQAVERSSESLVANERLITKVYFPRLVIPFAGATSALVDFAVACILYVGMMAYYRVLPGRALVFLPAFIVLAVIAASGIGLWLSALNVKYRDVRYAVPFLLQVWLFVTPVVYPASLVPPAYRAVYSLNPMAGVVEGFRWCLLGVGTGPGTPLLISAVAACVLLVGGAYYFKRMERSFADIV